MDVILRQHKNGEWYVYYDDREPMQATDAEVDLWLKLIKQTKDPERIFGKYFIELAKWGTLIIAILSFLGLYVDWNLASGTAKVLGIPDLTNVQFLGDPVHSQGAILLGYIIIVTVIIIFISWLSSNAILKFFSSRFLRKFDEIRDEIAIGILLSSVIVYVIPTDFLTSIQVIILYVFYFFIILVSWFILLHDRKNLENSPYFYVSSAIVLFMLFYVMFTTVPLRYGEILAETYVEGNDSKTPISVLITTKQIPVSEYVYVNETPDSITCDESDEWQYSSQIIKHPDYKKDFYSLQYLGSDENNYYVFDVIVKKVYAVPKNIVQSIGFESLKR